MTKERPILFSGAMVRAILAGQKTQTRRIVKPAPDIVHGDIVARHTPKDMELGRLGEIIRCPYGQHGDRLWVRETWGYNPYFPRMPSRACYRADRGHQHDGIKWKPSIHMPRALCRIALEITGVRVERLNDCSDTDAAAEGWPGFEDSSLDSMAWYADLWDQINGAGAWDANPWVWVIEFRRVA